VNVRSGVVAAHEAAVSMPAERDILDTAEVFGLLSDPGRLRLLVVLSAGEANVGTLSVLSGLSESATSHALRLLRAHEVVHVRRAGRLAFYRLADSHVGDLLSIALAHAQHSDVRHDEPGDLRHGEPDLASQP